jgi:hypothetical protein
MGLLGVRGGTLETLFDFSAWAEWILSLDAAWLFVPILVFVIVVVRLWSRGFKSDKTGEAPYD